MPATFAEVTRKIRAGEVIEVGMRDALFAASRELSSIEWCAACKTNKKDTFAFCTKTPRTDFQNGACPSCIQAGILCERDGDWHGFSD